MNDEEDWEQWRRFIGTNRICIECAAVMADPDKHYAWHNELIRQLPPPADDWA